MISIGKYFTQGKQAYQDGKHYTDNPYTQDYPKSEWLKGWQVAEHLASIHEQLNEDNTRG